MKNNHLILFFTALFVACISISCKESSPSVAKVFVRNSNNELMPELEVLIVADAELYPALDLRTYTNSSGYASFILDEYFAQFSDESPKVSDFKIYIRIEEKFENVGKLSSRANATAVETVFLDFE